MLDSILSLAVVVLLFMEICLKSRIGSHLEHEEEDEFKKLYKNIRWQMLMELGVILLCTVRSFLPEVTTFACSLILIIVVLTSITLYRNYRIYSIMTEYYQTHQK